MPRPPRPPRPSPRRKPPPRRPPRRAEISLPRLLPRFREEFGRGNHSSSRPQTQRMPDFLIDGDERAPTTILLAHGAGAPMDSASMTATARALPAAGFRVARFEFAYMAARRSGVRKPPPRAESVQPEYRAAIEALGAEGRLIIGGKSMGGRVASMIADPLHAEGKIVGLLCLGYPFHPPEKQQ